MTGKPGTKTNRLTGIFLVIFASICWGTTGIFIQTIIPKSGISPIGLAFWRDLISSLVLLVGILLFNPKLLVIKRKDIPWLIGMGVISIGTFHVFWIRSVVLLGASLATVFQYTSPIIVTVMAKFLFNEPLTLRKIIAIGLAIIGVFFITGLMPRGLPVIQPKGLVIALLSSITFAAFSLFGKKLSQDYDFWTILFYVFAIGTLTLFLYQGSKPDPLPIGSGVLIMILGFVLITILMGFSLFTKALSYLPASIASITATLEILFASIFAYYFLGEQLGGWQILGILLIIGGVVLVTITPKRSTSVSPAIEV